MGKNGKKPFITKNGGKRLLWDVVGRPVMRIAITSGVCFFWYISIAYLTLAYFPQFNYYEQHLINQGTNDNDVFLFWAWIPIYAFMLTGIFWASGLIGDFWKMIRRL